MKKFELDNQRRIRLNAVSCDLTMPHLSGIKLDFSDGFRSDRFEPETESCLYPKNYKEQKAEMDDNQIKNLEVRFCKGQRIDDRKGLKFFEDTQCLTFVFNGTSNYKKKTQLPKDHEIIGVEGWINFTGIISLSLLIAGPSMSLLSQHEKRAQFKELEHLKAGFEHTNERGLR